MKSWFFILAVAACCITAHPQSVVVGYRETITVPVPGAVSAFSMDDFFAEARAESGTLTIFGKNPGPAHVIVVTQEGSRTIEIRVLPAIPTYPPGFVRPLSAEAARESGSYESRFTSNPAQSENTVDFMRREGDRSMQFHMSDTFTFNPTGLVGPVALSSFFYQIHTPDRDVTFVDQYMVNSPLTLDGSTVRGFHLRQGNFFIHAGYTSVSSFENLILPAQKEKVLGVGYRVFLGKRATLTPNFYFLGGNRTLGDSVQRGTVASLVYRYELRKTLALLGEVGFSHGFGAAGRLLSESSSQQLIASLRYEPIHFASLGANSLHGFYSDVDWTRYLTPRLTSNYSFSDNHYNLPTFNLSNLVSTFNLQFQLSPHWSVTSGLNYGRSQSHLPPGPAISIVGVPAGINFDSIHFRSGFLYEYSRNSGTSSHSDEFRVTLGARWHNFRWNGYADRQTEVLTVAFILAGVPGLQNALDALGISATTPEEIALAISQTAGLVNQGLLAGINLNISPARVQAGSDFSWSSANSRQRFGFSLLYNKNESLLGGNRSTIGTLSYSLKFKKVNELFSSISLLREGGQAGMNAPLVEIAIRHQVGRTPNFLIRRRRGDIGGIVFSDDGATGAYRSGDATLLGVEVILDDSRRTRTDKTGHYRFGGASYGSHSVEAVYHSSRPFFFTTPSTAQSEINEEVNFGIGRSFSRLFGVVRSDAGNGVPEIEISVAQGGKLIHVRTDSEGKFRCEGLSPGEYDVTIDAYSVPPGYSLAGLEATKATLDPSMPAQVAFALKAIRNISGRITLYDAASQREMPVPAIGVVLGGKSLTSISDGNGVYLFRDLPAGSYHLSVLYEGKEFDNDVILPDGPAFPKDINFNLTTKRRR